MDIGEAIQRAAAVAKAQGSPADIDPSTGVSSLGSTVRLGAEVAQSGGWEPVVVQLRSSWLSEASWEPLTGYLELTTVSGDSYSYPAISLSQFIDLIQSPSPGKWWHANLK